MGKVLIWTWVKDGIIMAATKWVKNEIEIESRWEWVAGFKIRVTWKKNWVEVVLEWEL